MTTLILHLSDSHFRNSTNYVHNRTNEIASATYRALPDAEHVLIVFSGDIAFSGKPEEYEIAKKFLLSIREKVITEKDVPVYFVMSPGNHDCDFSKADSIRQLVVDQLRSRGETMIDAAIISTCTQVQTAFDEFRSSLNTPTLTHTDPLLNQYTLNVQGNTILFSALNAAWMSTLHEQQGRLVFPCEQYRHLLDTKCDLHVIVMHHPLNWYHQSTYQPFRSLLRSAAHVICTGHEHSASGFELDDSINRRSVYLEAPALQTNDHGQKSGFSTAELNLDEKQYRLTAFNWTGKHYAPVEVSVPWASYRKLPTKSKQGLHLTKRFLNDLEDAGAGYVHKRKEHLVLSDLFVFPDLKKPSETRKNPKLVSSNIFQSLTQGKTRTIITGDDQSGKTSLLKILFKQYYDGPYYPLLVSANRLRRATSAELDKVLKECIAEQYAPESIEPWLSLPKKEKVLLVDDFHSTPVADRYRAVLIEHIEKRFDHLLMTADSAQDVRDLVSPETADALSSFDHYEIQPLGHQLRYDLIRRWQLLGDDHSLDSKKLLADIDESEKVLDTVIGANIVPRTPLLLITLLQSLDDETRQDLRASAYGYYYYYLILRALDKARFPAVQLDELFNYCSHLAWIFHCSSTGFLELIELRNFNDVFSGEYVTVEFKARLQLLLDANILRRHGGSYVFAYKYIYYFFLGMHISKQIDEDQEIENLVHHCCTNLHVRENANTILFVTHHCRDPRVIDAIVGKLRTTFSDVKPLDLLGDTSAINELVDSTARLVFRPSDPDKNRRKAKKLMDEMDEKFNGDNMEHSSKQSQLLAQEFTTLVSTVDILGQILKNYYGTLRNERKIELMMEIYDGSLRAMRSFVDSIEENREGFVKDIERALKKVRKKSDTTRAKNAPRRFAFEIIAAMAFGFIHRASRAIGSVHLAETARKLMLSDSPVAYKLIGLTAILDSPGPLSVSEIRSLGKETESNLLAHRMLDIAVLQHLYFFKTTEKEKQELTAALGISMARQRAIEYQSKDLKLIK